MHFHWKQWIYILANISDESLDEFEGIVAFDPFQRTINDLERCHLISLPPDFGRGWGPKFENVRLEVVLGQLRLS